MGKYALVCGAGGFIGGHLVKRLKREGFWVRGVDLKFPEFAETEADDFVIGDLRDPDFCRTPVVDRRFDEVYQLAADMGGAGYIFTGEHDADVMHNSATINLNMLDACPQARHPSGSSIRPRPACIRPTTRKIRTNPNCAEDSRLSGGTRQRIRLGEAVQRAALSGLSHATTGCEPRVARFHNIFGPEGTWDGGQREGAGRDLPQGRRGAQTAARSRSGATASRPDRSSTSTNASKGTVRLMRSDFAGPGEHRLGGDGHHQPAGRDRRRDRRQADRRSSTSRARWACAAATPTTG